MEIAFVSLGCDKNLVDSEIMLGLIDEEGFIITDDEENADLVIINTCGFILDATNESIENILNIVRLKEEGKVKGIIVTGCMVQRYKDEIFESIPEIDAIVGTSDFDSIGKIIKSVLNGDKVSLVTDKNRRLDDNLAHKRMLSTPPYFAYLKISEGCDNHCTYCTIPSLRGKYRERSIESLVKEAGILASKGVKELVLVAQDTSIYGTSLYEENKLHVLLKELSKIDSIEWIRILYCYPEHITDETINEIAQNKKICKYIDMPIQHCSDKILKSMGRRTTKENLKNIINKIRTKIPDISLRTTLIAGFPGESSHDFNELLDFIKEMKFNKLGAFAYSKEDGTPAAKLLGQLDDEVKNSRKEIIMEQQRIISNEINQNHIGKIFDVIVEGYLPDDEVYCGRTFMDAYEVDGLVFFKSGFELISGDFVKIKITEAFDYDLLGVIV